jgi:hypothetical protein
MGTLAPAIHPSYWLEGLVSCSFGLRPSVRGRRDPSYTSVIAVKRSSSAEAGTCPRSRDWIGGAVPFSGGSETFDYEPPTAVVS